MIYKLTIYDYNALHYIQRNNVACSLTVNHLNGLYRNLVDLEFVDISSAYIKITFKGLWELRLSEKYVEPVVEYVTI